VVYGWQLLFLPLAVVIGALLLRAFLRIVSAAELAGLCAGAGIFLAGALGVESMEARGVLSNSAWWTTEAARTLLLEEGLEMAGVTVVVVVLAHRHFASRARARAMSPSAT
jgi:hypothetical protein